MDLDAAVATLWRYHDAFFPATAAEKSALLSRLSADIVAAASTELAVGSRAESAAPLPPAARARLLYVMGTALDAAEAQGASSAAKRSGDGRSPRELLEQSVKLNPDSGDAWQALGHACFKVGDLPAARAALEQALARRRNPETLRLYGMLLRQMHAKGFDVGAGAIDAAGTAAAGAAAAGAAAAGAGAGTGAVVPAAAVGGGGTSAAASVAAAVPPLVQRSLDASMEAVRLNVRDAESWSSLGNAHLALFFAAGHDPTQLQKALSAYARGVKLEEDAVAATEAAPSSTGDAAASVPSTGDAGTGAAGAGAGDTAAAAAPLPALSLRHLPDLHFNRATVLSYAEEFAMAISEYAAAAAADPTMACMTSIGNIRTFLEKVTMAIVKHGGLKGRRLTDAAAAVAAYSPDAAALGGRTRVASVSALSPGPNPGRYIVLRPLLPISKHEEPPAVVVAMDGEQVCASLATYHLTEDAVARWSERDIVVVLDPVLKVVCGTAAMLRAAASPAAAGEAARATADERTNPAWNYASIQVLAPEHLLVNGRTMRPATRNLLVRAFDA